MIQQNNFRSFIYGQSYTNPANLVKIRYDTIRDAILTCARLAFSFSVFTLFSQLNLPHATDN